MPSKPETRVPQGQEEQALQTHVRRMTQWATGRQIQALVDEFGEEERARRKLMKIALVIVALLLGAFLLFALSLTN